MTKMMLELFTLIKHHHHKSEWKILSLIFKIRGYVKAQTKFSAFHKNNRPPNIKRCLAKTETCTTLAHCLKKKYHLKINLEGSKWVATLLLNNL